MEFLLLRIFEKSFIVCKSERHHEHCCRFSSSQSESSVLHLSMMCRLADLTFWNFDFGLIPSSAHG